MEVLNIKGGEEIPSVYCDASKGLVEIKGKSIPEDPFREIFKPVLAWMREYSKKSPAETIVNIQLEYFNTSSSKYLFDVFRILESIHHNIDDTTVNINWYYEEDDEDMLEAGQDYQAIIKVPFKMIMIKL